MIGREPDATELEVKKSEECTLKLSNIVNLFILRRTNTLNVKYLPPKLTQVVCIKLTSFQKQLYQHMMLARQVIEGEEKEKNKNGVSAMALASINSMKKLCNHAQLVYQKESKYSHSTKSNSRVGYGMADINAYFPEGFGDSAAGGGRRSRGPSSGVSSSSTNLQWSGKFQVLANMLELMFDETDDRMVVVSNYTQTLDLLSLLCKERNYSYVRLDGSVSAKNRQKMVDRLNDPNSDCFIFLLSSKAGGCGLNLIGANRLILFDPDWNPATDKQGR